MIASHFSYFTKLLNFLFMKFQNFAVIYWKRNSFDASMCHWKSYKNLLLDMGKSRKLSYKNPVQETKILQAIITL
jgi:hypothetical protein